MDWTGGLFASGFVSGVGVGWFLCALAAVWWFRDRRVR